MPSTPVRSARSAGRRVFSDARFFIGLAIVIASIAGVWFVVTAGRVTTPVVVAARTIVPGEKITAGDLRTVDVALGATQSAYASTGQADGLIAVRSIGEGEIVPTAALADASAGTTEMVVRSSAALPRSVVTGTIVEVWAAPQTERGMFGEPVVLVSSATVSGLVASEGVVNDGTTAVELVVDRADVGRLLSARAAGDSLSIVPLGASGVAASGANP